VGGTLGDRLRDRLRDDTCIINGGSCCKPMASPFDAERGHWAMQLQQCSTPGGHTAHLEACPAVAKAVNQSKQLTRG
jgi:hypothetical protein